MFRYKSKKVVEYFLTGIVLHYISLQTQPLQKAFEETSLTPLSRKICAPYVDRSYSLPILKWYMAKFISQNEQKHGCENRIKVTGPKANTFSSRPTSPRLLNTLLTCHD